MSADSILKQLREKAKDPNTIYNNLYGKLCNESILSLAYATIEKKGQYYNVSEVLLSLSNELSRQVFCPGVITQVALKKADSTERIISLITDKDKTVHNAIKIMLEPIFEPEFMNHTYAFRKHLCTKNAVQDVIMTIQKGYTYAYKFDVKNFFDSIDHEILLNILQTKIKDTDFLHLCKQLLTNMYEYNGKLYRKTSGISQGSPLSPLLSNIYLCNFDNFMTHTGRFMKKNEAMMFRYADDILILAKKRSNKIETNVKKALKKFSLQLNPEKTKSFNAQKEAIEYLGFEITSKGNNVSSAIWYAQPAPKAINQLNEHLLKWKENEKSTKSIKQYLKSWCSSYTINGFNWDRETCYSLNSMINKNIGVKNFINHFE